MSLALYRKYRPGTFAEVKGQEHVTEPLRQALRSGRINHAYLFSGPRGCGKTSSARILARSLNCEKGPTPDPCGQCESCVALAPTGPGHLDVIEIDAASHGGVDDARDLRERAFFAPVSSRFKIYIIDEAHMVTREGFNALLKLVEEPPPHLKFVFATTEPEKVIGTIKSRTHHYPFRLIPPAALRTLMEEILTSEKVSFEPAALPLVVRAGAGSARDSLSILDQLYAGSGEAGITYAGAVSLLGYTDGDLLDDVVVAFAARDGARAFQVVNRVIEGGHDPRRFAMDLLERFRDLVILANVPEAASSGLLDRPADELERLQEQAGSMGPAELTRAAEILNTGLTEMRGAASPRLLLELMCARILLPGAAEGEAALLARVERLEQGGIAVSAAPRDLAGSRRRSRGLSRHAGTGSAGRDPGVRTCRPGTRPPGPGGAPAAAVAGTRSHGARPRPGRGRPGRRLARDGPARRGPGTAGPAPRPAARRSGGGHRRRVRVVGAVGARRGCHPGLRHRSHRNGAAGVAPGARRAQAAQHRRVGQRQHQRADRRGRGQHRHPGVHPGRRHEELHRRRKGRGRRGGPEGGPRRHVEGRGRRRRRSRPVGRGTVPVPAPALPPARHPSARPGPARSGPARRRPAARGPAAGTAAAAGPPPRHRPRRYGRHPPGRSRPPTDESWPDEPMPEDPGSPPPPSPGLAAARSAAKAAAQTGPRAPARNGAKAAAWPDAVPGRASRAAPDADEVDPLNDADADVDALTGMALIQRELGGQIIEEIDHT
ncbi:hypothetical protein GCM10017559_23670 [Streptosporangium longisporum]|uniref:DNA polymerase III subunit gamma/tau n=1 Tax=Streptosporangium longisporum TaxID=46187 RepID=A0ABP6KFP2_9ACTN